MLTLALINSLPHGSFDPLEADYSHNRLVARLLFATPIETSADNRLVSSVLKFFDYDESSRTISLEIRETATYSDGSFVTAEDVALAILRLALNRPFFPVVRYIDGLADWSKSREPLRSYPSGLSIRGSKIQIRLSRNQNNALFRLTLEVFSILPKKCFDLASGKMTCPIPPSSGPYLIEKQASDSMDFKRRFPKTTYGEALPENLRIAFWPVTHLDLSENLDDRTIVSGWESGLHDASPENLKKFSVRWLPRSWFTTLILNPNVAPFDSNACRIAFADEFRKNFRALNDPNGPLEGSAFTPILPGYLPLSELEGAKQGTNDATCRERISNSIIRWATVGATTTPFRSTLVKTLKSFGIDDVSPVLMSSYEQSVESFLKNETSIMGYSSGFWAQDPVGDLQMYFSPGVHPVLNPVTKDHLLQQMLSELDDSSGDQIPKKLESINRYLFKNGISNVVAHVRKFYLAKKEGIISDPASAISSPAPWQIFKGDE